MFESGLLAVHHADISFSAPLEGACQSLGGLRLFFSWPGLHYSRYHSYISNVDTKIDTNILISIKSEKSQFDMSYNND